MEYSCENTQQQLHILLFHKQKVVFIEIKLKTKKFNSQISLKTQNFTNHKSEWLIKIKILKVQNPLPGNMLFQFSCAEKGKDNE